MPASSRRSPSLSPRHWSSLFWVMGVAVSFAGITGIATDTGSNRAIVRSDRATTSYRTAQEVISAPLASVLRGEGSGVRGPRASFGSILSSKISPEQIQVITDAGSVRHEAIALLPDSQVSDQSEADAELEKERVAAERFLTVLEKNPRRGTALDKVYTFHVDRGSLNSWVQKYRDRVRKDPQDGPAWMLLGLIDLQRGQDAAAVQGFYNAEKFLPDNPLAAYYLGQSLVLVGKSEDAAAALERALQRNPAQVDQLEIFQALGRIYQRTRQADKALAVWQRLEKLFPNDWRIQEQIAQTLVEEGQPELALPRFEALATKTSKDLYRQSQFRIQAADLKVQLSKTSEALADFEKLLGN